MEPAITEIDEAAKKRAKLLISILPRIGADDLKQAREKRPLHQTEVRRSERQNDRTGTGFVINESGQIITAALAIREGDSGRPSRSVLNNPARPLNCHAQAYKNGRFTYRDGAAPATATRLRRCARGVGRSRDVARSVIRGHVYEDDGERPVSL